ncbi:hypothetical protein [Paenarthrobacter sp. YJN-5]|uniref:hypothetical protein n=1 Tax=Paenarthrobacter sp. YJN-5 TaxID=2735316 RepID=UPI001878975A|nr:hypothetical protein [Paenarthrobacter sp. YJN-5]QOT19627.1 hypothetical protein HMI59_23730 [Paenarthrobacter sp. YJN-5]
MKRALKKITQSRSLQRRWALTDAEPVRSYLDRDRTFVPADLRIWWCADAEQPVKDHSLHIYAWPADRNDNLSAHWTNGYNHDPIPEWIRELSEVVHEDLMANATSTNTGIEDLWTYAVDRDWILEDAPAVPSIHNPSMSFRPATLSIWHTFNPKDPYRHDRHRITAHHADWNSIPRVFADWGGGADWQGNPRYSHDLPAWIGKMADEQHAQLVAFATKHESGRRTR